MRAIVYVCVCCKKQTCVRVSVCVCVIECGCGLSACEREKERKGARALSTKRHKCYTADQKIWHTCQSSIIVNILNCII